jgi:hypothetical protein
MRTRRFRPVMEFLSSRIVPSDLALVAGSIGNPASPTDQQGLISGDTEPGTLPLAPPYCGGASTTTSSGAGTVLVITPSSPAA